MSNNRIVFSKYKRKCRLCLGKPAVAFDLTDDKIKMVETITSIKLIIDDPRFDVICCKCNLDLQLINKILDKFRTADTKLKQLIEQGNLSDINDESDIGKNENNVDEDPIIDEIITKQEVLSDNDEDSVEIHGQEIIETTVTVVNNAVAKINDNYQKSPYAKLEEWLKDKSRSRTCDTCGKVVSLARFKSHLYLHQRIDCKICHKSISSTNLSTHMQSVHSSNSAPLICDICGVKMKNLNSFRTHKIRYHNNTNRYTCEYCGKEFIVFSRLKSHIDRLHLKVAKTNICEQCGKSFYSKYLLNIHIKTKHENIRKYLCQYCDKGFTTLFAMRTHERQHTNETPYKCEICGDGFRQNISLRTHRKRKHNIIEELNVSCTFCTKKFPTEWALRTHVFRMHPTKADIAQDN